MNELRGLTLRGLFWSFSERGGYQLIQFLVAITLARLLLPEHFGLMAILTVFISLSLVFVDAGFGSALIQKQDANHTDECSVFYFNILLGFLMAMSLYFAAPSIAKFYENPILTSLARVLSINLIIAAFGAVHVTLLIKRVDFRKQMYINLASAIASGAFAITMALNGYGIWSLVSQSISATLLRTGLLWTFHYWRPNSTFSFESLKSMFPFGSRLMLSSILNISFGSLYALVIGKVYSPKDLGFFARAEQLQQLPVINLADSVSRVTYPIFCSVQTDKPRLKRQARRAIMFLAFVNFPLMIFLATMAKPLVLILLTDRWLPSVPYLQLLCIAGLTYPLDTVNLNVLKAQGFSSLFLRLEIIKKILFAGSVGITYRWGITAMIIGGILVSICGYFINAFYTGKYLSYPASEQMRDVGASLLLASLTGFCIYGINFVAGENELTLLVVQLGTGVIVYSFLCWLCKLQPFLETQNVLVQSLSALYNKKRH